MKGQVPHWQVKSPKLHSTGAALDELCLSRAEFLTLFGGGRAVAQGWHLPQWEKKQDSSRLEILLQFPLASNPHARLCCKSLKRTFPDKRGSINREINSPSNGLRQWQAISGLWAASGRPKYIF